MRSNRLPNWDIVAWAGRGTHSLMEGTYTLVGMLDSPFVRRVAVVLERYGYSYENLPLKTMGNVEQFAAYSPLKRAPTLIMPSGAALFDSHLIVDHLDETVPPGASLLPSSTEERLLCRQVVGIASGVADKSVSALYERTFHDVPNQSAALLTRMRGQVADSLAWLEQHAPSSGFLFGARLSHADIMVGTALCFAIEANPDMVQLEEVPSLQAWLGRLSALAEFKKTYLAIEPPS